MRVPKIYSETRKSGIALIGDLPWGSHFCQFYDTQKELSEILLPYFRAGLASNEGCLWAIPKDLDLEQGRTILKKGLRRFDEFLEKGQIQILSYVQWRHFTKDPEIALVTELDAAVRKGFEGLRFVSPAIPAARKSPRATDFIGKYNVIGLFTYPRGNFSAAGLIEIVNRHRYTLVRNAGKWEVMESSEARIVKDELNRSEQKLQLLFHHMSEAFAFHRLVVDEHGKPSDYVFLEANEAFEKLTSLEVQAIIGKRATDVLPGIEKDPNDWIGRYGEVALTGNPVQFESYSEQLKKWYSVSAFSPYRGFFAVTFSDITERKGVEAQLRKAHDQLDQKVRESTEELRRAIGMLRMISECNQVLVRATGEEELMREICRIMVEMGGYRMAWVGYAEDDEEKSVRPVASMGCEQDYLESARVSWADVPRGRGPTGKCIRTGTVQFGRNFPEAPEMEPWREEALKRRFVSSVALPLISAGKAFGALTIYSDLPDAFDGSKALLRELADDLAFGIVNLRARAERDQARQAAENRAAQLQALAVELVQAEQKERRQLARILHDHLQQILVGAKFGASLIRAKSKGSNKDVEQVAEELIGTIDEAIRASRSLSADLSPPILHEKGLAAGLKWLGRQMQEKHGLNVEIEADEGTEPETEQIRQFLFESVRELLFNTVKYAQVDHAEVRMRMLQNGEVEITVADKGAGFDPAKIGISPSTVGGFGLFSIRERLSYLRGTMEIDAAPGRGSRFVLRAPARVSTTNQAGGGTSTSALAVNDALRENAAASADQITLVLADDHPVLRRGLAKLLEEQPDIHVLGEAGDGRAVVDLARRLKPDVVLMDVGLPLMNGFEATRRILSECPGTRVIGLSMHEEPEMSASMLEAGASAYLTKGGPIESLITVIRSCRLEKFYAGKAK